MFVEAAVYDAFTEEPGRGNPAGVVCNADTLTEGEMQAVAAKLGFNETAFVLRSDRADHRVRYFSPGREVPMCGHATVASMAALAEKEGRTERMKTIETLSGILDIQVSFRPSLMIGMTQDVYRERAFAGDRERLAAALGIRAEDIDGRYPLVYASTGLWTLLVPIRTLPVFEAMQPDNAAFPDILTEIHDASVHPFCLHSVDPAAAMHGRHFSSPFSKTKEDPVTGTASGAMGMYYSKYVMPSAKTVLVEQGNEIGRSGRVEVRLPEQPEGRVCIYGTAVFERTVNVELGG